MLAQTLLGYHADDEIARAALAVAAAGVVLIVAVAAALLARLPRVDANANDAATVALVVAAAAVVLPVLALAAIPLAARAIGRVPREGRKFRSVGALVIAGLVVTAVAAPVVACVHTDACFH